MSASTGSGMVASEETDAGSLALGEGIWRLVPPNVRAKRATTVGRQARAVENAAHRRPGLAARRWRSA